MQINTKTLLLGLGLLALLSNGDRIKAELEAGQSATQIDRAAAQVARDDLAAARATDRTAQAESALAIARYESGCIKIVDAATQREGFFVLAQQVIDKQLGQPLREAAIVCNSLGDTGVIRGGGIAEIKRVSAADYEENKELIEGNHE